MSVRILARRVIYANIVKFSLFSKIISMFFPCIFPGKRRGSRWFDVGRVHDNCPRKPTDLSVGGIGHCLFCGLNRYEFVCLFSFSDLYETEFDSFFPSKSLITK